MFTVRIAHEGNWVMLADPDAVKQVFTGDPRCSTPARATSCCPVLGHHSVLLLDDAAHMRQRKLLLPPFHGERMRGYGEVMAEVAAEIESGRAGSPPPSAPDAGDHAGGDHARRLRRAGRARRERRRHLGEVLEWGSDPAWRCWPRSARSRGQLAHVPPRASGRRADLRGDPRAAPAPDLDERDDVLSLLVQARHEDGSR